MALATILTLCFVIHVSNGLYFHIGETERKCFIEEIPDETMVTGEVKTGKLSHQKFRSIILQEITKFNFTTRGRTGSHPQVKALECTLKFAIPKTKSF